VRKLHELIVWSFALQNSQAVRLRRTARVPELEHSFLKLVDPQVDGLFADALKPAAVLCCVSYILLVDKVYVENVRRLDGITYR
jgi:hypothetical protein